MNSKHRHIMLFDLYSNGHHAIYIKQLCWYWIDQQCTGKLSIVVSASYVLQHRQLLAFIRRHQSEKIVLYIIPGLLPLENERSILNLLRNDRLHGQFARQYIEQLRPTHVMFLFMDHIQIAMGSGLRFNYEVVLSGILFRPTLHYPAIGCPAASWKERIWHARKKMILRYALRNRHMRYLFSLDPYAVPYLQRLSKHTTCFVLPDGYTHTPSQKMPIDMRNGLGVEPKRLIALFFGIVSERKGIRKVIESLDELSTSAQKQLCLLIVGRSSKEESWWITKKLAAIKRTNAVQVIWNNCFVPDYSIQDFFCCSDLALVTYQRHVGSSHVLIRAAAEGVPVLGSDYGLVGKNIVTHQLGIATETTKAKAIARSLEAWIYNDSLGSFNIEHARAFAAQNDAKQFSATIFNALS